MRHKILLSIAVSLMCLGLSTTYAATTTNTIPATKVTQTAKLEAPASDVSNDNANDEIETDDAVIPVKKEEAPSIFDFLDVPQKEISGGLEWLSKRIDVFFANENLYEESTGSFARLSGTMILGDGGKKSFLGDLNIRAVLPRTQKKLNLIIESDADKNLSNRPDQQNQPTPNEALSNTTYYAGIQKKIAPKSVWDVHTSVGIKLHIPLDPFVRLRMSREVLLQKWKFHFTETLFHFHSRGNGHDATMEWDRALSKTDLFRIHSSATWWDDTDTYDLNQSFSVFHEFTERRAMSYSISVFGTNKPRMTADTYLLDLRYRQLLHKDWLFYEINPQILYRKENNFRAEHSVAIKLEMIFGQDHFRTR